jgi:hypothetical protein
MKNKSTTSRPVGRPPSPVERRRYAWIGVHVTDGEKCECKAAAARFGGSFSSWMRSCLGLPNKSGE